MSKFVFCGITKLKIAGSQLVVSSLNTVPARRISGKHLRIEKKKPPPFPYETKNYTKLRTLWDSTHRRFDENTKVIVVEGPIAAGKTEFAKKLAEELDMKHIPEPTMDEFYINYSGYDLRQLDPKLPLKARSFDEKNFCQDPYHVNVSMFQYFKRKVRYSIYFDALNHLFNTGQGIVCERSPYSDAVFLNAMHECGYVPTGVRSYYEETWEHCHLSILRPHLVIYLDVPVPKVMENIKKRDIPYERNSPALTEQFLTKMEENYKNVLLTDLSKDCKMLMYDWSEGGDAEVVVEDIERIDDFDIERHRYDPMLKHWDLENWELDVWRHRFSCQKFREMMGFHVVARLDVPELLLDGNDLFVLEQIWNNAPGMKYSVGYDPSKDKGIWWKWKFYDSEYDKNT